MLHFCNAHSKGRHEVPFVQSRRTCGVPTNTLSYATNASVSSFVLPSVVVFNTNGFVVAVGDFENP